MVPPPDSPSTSRGPGIGPPELSPDWPELEKDAGPRSPRKLSPGASACERGPGALPPLPSASPPSLPRGPWPCAARGNRETRREAAEAACVVHQGGGGELLACGRWSRPSVRSAPTCPCSLSREDRGISSSSTSQSLLQIENHICAVHGVRDSWTRDSGRPSLYPVPRWLRGQCSGRWLPPQPTRWEDLL